MHRSGGPVEIDHYRTLLVENACEKAEEKLMSLWFPPVIGLFSGEKNLLEGTKMSNTQTNRFFNCVSTLIANQVSVFHIGTPSFVTELLMYVLISENIC